MPTKNSKPAPKAKSKKASPIKPKFLDTLRIPGMSPAFAGYDGGIPLWLLNRGLTVTVDKNWPANPGDVIQVLNIVGMTVLADKTLKPGEEAHNSFSFAILDSELPEGDLILGYKVLYAGGPSNDLSYPLTLMVKRTLPGGVDRDIITPGHSELHFSISDTEIREIQAGRGVIITIQPYPNMDPLDRIECQVGSYLVPAQQVAGVGLPTEIKLNRDQIILIGNGKDRLVSFQVVDAVRNVSTPRSANIKILVDIGSANLAAPIFATQQFPGMIDLEMLNGEPLHMQLFTYSFEGKLGNTYFATYRGYPKLGGVVLHQQYIEIEAVNRPHDFFVPNDKVRAIAGGKAEISFILLDGLDILNYSRIASAAVQDAIIRLQPPFFTRYPTHVVNPIPTGGAAVEIPWYAWRRPTDKIMLLMRYVIPGSNELILYDDLFTVGSVPVGVPIRRLIPHEALLKFNGTTPDLYYVYEPENILARSTSLNESLRQDVQIGALKKRK
ncbi:hypothetical protein [Pseudomonas sp. RIT357]|uniref:hypothetical protein n=1 Tax=Pseudomonas sp. RIT357 TaxID=1470593 RepID=UPI00044588E5|nr:hypothetical protein [Pseudomonas sp. RIT357]EZP65204.1 hypothetical protein BW43_03573 [Pseudomonas sp. RIT357]